jgi:hypothetical protein
MAKGFIIAITVVLILVVMLLYTQNFAAKQSSDLSSIAQLLVGEKVTHTWSDVRDDILKAVSLLVTQQENNATFYDYLPFRGNVSEFLSMYGRFIIDNYTTPDLNITFYSPSGQSLGDLPSTITILPQDISYEYQNIQQGHRALQINVPPPNNTWISKIFMNIALVNATLTDTCVVKDFSPSSFCDKNTLANESLNLTLSFSDSDIPQHNCTFGELCFDLKKPSGSSYDVHAGGGFFRTLIGPLNPDGEFLIQVVDLQQKFDLNATTSIILNTSDFYISYLANIGVDAVNYNTNRIDRA